MTASWRIRNPPECLRWAHVSRTTASRAVVGRSRQSGPQLPRGLLVVLPEYIEERSSNDEVTAIERVRTMRAAVMIDIVTRCPLRIGNWHNLRLNRHLAYLDGPRRSSHILIETEETKNDRPINSRLPEEAGNLIKRHLDQSRHLLAKPGNPYLLPGSGLQALSINQTRYVFEQYV